jgi:signal transduction histidine kinase
VLQEALANVARHSGAAAASVRLQWRGGAIHLAIEDRGRGFTPDGSRRGLGLVAMRERAALLGGVLEVTNLAEGGTRVRLTVPITTASVVA